MMEPTWIFRKVDDKYIPFNPDNKDTSDPLTKEGVEQRILYRGSLVDLDLDKIPHANISVSIHDGMVKYFMIEALSGNLKTAMRTNKVVTAALKITYRVDNIANILNYDIVLFQDEYRTKIEAEIIKVMWNNTIKGIINSIREMFPSTSVTTESVYQALGIDNPDKLKVGG